MATSKINKVQESKWKTQYRTVTIDSDGNATVQFSGVKIDAGIVIVSYHYIGNNGGGVLVHTIGYYGGVIGSTGHNSAPTVAFAGNSNDMKYNITNGISGLQLNISILYPDVNYES